MNGKTPTPEEINEAIRTRYNMTNCMLDLKNGTLSLFVDHYAITPDHLVRLSRMELNPYLRDSRMAKYHSGNRDHSSFCMKRVKRFSTKMRVQASRRAPHPPAFASLGGRPLPARGES